MNQIVIHREVLNWAAEKAGESVRTFAEAVARRERDRESILEGRLTIPQIEKLAKKARIPFGFLFLNTPPHIERKSIPDLRRVQSADPLSENFFETFDDVVAKQEWYIEHLHELGLPELPFVGKFKNIDKRNWIKIAEDIKTVLGIGDEDRRQSVDPEAYFSKLSAKAERAGVLVFKNSIVKNQTRRSLSEKEFRGFAISHPYAPVIFINGRDAEVAAVFTLMHELAHIWIGADGISDIALHANNPIEVLCNKVAAEVLVPNQIFTTQWKGAHDIDRLAKYFRVSRLVIARRALDNNLIEQATYDDYARRPHRAKPTGKPSALRVIPIRNSKRFTEVVVTSALSGNTMLREAANLLNVKPDTVMTLGKRLVSHD